MRPCWLFLSPIHFFFFYFLSAQRRKCTEEVCIRCAILSDVNRSVIVIKSITAKELHIFLYHWRIRSYSEFWLNKIGNRKPSNTHTHTKLLYPFELLYPLRVESSSVSTLKKRKFHDKCINVQVHIPSSIKHVEDVELLLLLLDLKNRIS